MNEKEGFAIDYIKSSLRINDKPLIEVSPSVLETVLDIIDNLEKEIEELRSPTICGRTIEEITNILNGLDLEKETELKVTMDNMKHFMAIYQKEIEDSLRNATTNLVRDISGTGARIEFQIPHYDFLTKEKGE